MSKVRPTIRLEPLTNSNLHALSRPISFPASTSLSGFLVTLDDYHGGYGGPFSLNVLLCSLAFREGQEIFYPGVEVDNMTIAREIQPCLFARRAEA